MSIKHLTFFVIEIAGLAGLSLVYPIVYGLSLFDMSDTGSLSQKSQFGTRRPRKMVFVTLAFLFFTVFSVHLHSEQTSSVSVWITSDIEGYLAGCDCPSGASAGLSALAAALESRDSSTEPLLDAGGFREPDRSDPLLEKYMDLAASSLGYTGLVVVSADLRDGGPALRLRARGLPLSTGGAFADSGLFVNLPGEKSALILAGENSSAQSLQVAVAQWAGTGERERKEPNARYTFGPAANVTGLKGFLEADFRILIIRGSLNDGEEFFRQVSETGDWKPGQIDLLLFTGAESPASGLASGGMAGSLERAGLTIPWMSLAPRGNGLGRAVFSAGLEVKVEAVGLERGSSPESDDILAMGDSYMDELVSRAMEAANGKKKIRLPGRGEAAASNDAAADFQVDYWYPYGCRDCDDFLWNEVPELERKNRRTVLINEKDTGDPVEFEALLAVLKDRGEVLLALPVMVTPDSVLQGNDQIKSGLEKLLNSGFSSHSGIPEGSREKVPAAWEPGAVALAGLLDGVNPCAFSAMVFLVSALAMAGRSKKTLLAIGLFYAAGIFITYSLIGAGLLGGLRRIAVGSNLRNILEWGLGCLLLVLAVLSIVDGIRLSRGRNDLLLKLPRRLSARIHGLIREEVRSGAAAGGAFVLGALVALIELGCTGQVYLPTIAWMIARGEGYTPWLWLIIYNGAFIIPLLIVFAVSYKGVSAVRLAGLFRRQGSTVKFITAGLLFILAAVVIIV